MRFKNEPAPTSDGMRFKNDGPQVPTGGGEPLLDTSTKLYPELALPKMLRERRLVEQAAKPLGDPTGMGDSDIFSHSFTWGLLRPWTGFTNATLGALNERLGIGQEADVPASFGERFHAGEQAYDEKLARAREKAGGVGTAVGVAGSLLSGGPSKKFLVPGAPPVSLARGATQGAVASGIQGAAESDADTLSGRVSDAAKSAVEGAAISAGLSAAVRAPGYFGRRARSRDINRGPKPEALKNASQANYAKLKQAGILYDPRQASFLNRQIKSVLGSEGYNPGMHTDIKAVLGDLDLATAGPMSLERLQQTRTQFADAARSPDPRVRRMAGFALRELDNFVQRSTPRSGSMGRAEVAETSREASRLWRQKAKTEDILWNVGKAEKRAASTASGANVENPLRQNIRSVLDRAEKPGRYSPYSPEELDMMRNIVDGGRTQNFLRATGNRFGGSGPLSTSPGVGLGAGAGWLAHQMGVDPMLTAALGSGTTALSWGLGKAARSKSATMAENQVDDLIRFISSGGAPAPRINARSLQTPTRENLVRLVAGGGPRAIESFFGNR